MNYYIPWGTLLRERKKWSYALFGASASGSLLELWSPSGAVEDLESALKRLAVVENPYIRFFVTFWCFYFFGALELWSPSGAVEDFESALKRLAVVENP